MNELDGMIELKGITDHTHEADALRQEMLRLQNRSWFGRLADKLMDLVSSLVSPVLSCVKIEVELPTKSPDAPRAYCKFDLRFDCAPSLKRRQARIQWIQKRLRDAPCTCEECVGLEQSLLLDEENRHPAPTFARLRAGRRSAFFDWS